MPTKSPKSPGKKRWRVYHIGGRADLIGTVTAVTAEEALEAAMKEFNIPERDKRRTMVRQAGSASV